MCQTSKLGRIFCIQGLLFLVVYLAGGVTGAVIWQAVGQPERPFKHFRDNPGRFEENIARRIVGRYGLPPQSEEKLIEIIHANNLQLQAVHKEFSPKFEACLREMQSKIRELIPVDRRAEYDQEVKEMRGRMAAFQPPRDHMRPGKPQSAEPGERGPQMHRNLPQRPDARPGEPHMGMEMKKEGFRHHAAENDRRGAEPGLQNPPFPPQPPAPAPAAPEVPAAPSIPATTPAAAPEAVKAEPSAAPAGSIPVGVPAQPAVQEPVK